MGHLGENNEKSETEGWLWKHLLSYTNILFLPSPHFINSLSCSKIDLLLLWLGKTPPKSVICWNRPFIFLFIFNYLKNKLFRKLFQPVSFPSSLNDYLEPPPPPLSVPWLAAWEFGVCECLLPEFQGRMRLFPFECPLGFWSKRW